MRQDAYPYLSGDGVPVAQPLFQEDGDGSIPISPLQLHFEETDVRTACQLVALWHSRLPRIDYSNVIRGGLVHCYRAVFGNRIYAVAIWTRPVAANRMADGYRLMELRRFAISPEAPKNTASRMLAWMTRDIRRVEPDVMRLVSYQDMEVHAGTIYKASGWIATYISEFKSWSEHADFDKASKKPDQSTSPKQRWEIAL